MNEYLAQICVLAIGGHLVFVWRRFMDTTIMELLLFSLASFRLTRLLVFDKITAFIRKPFFEEMEVEEDGKKETYIVPKKKGLKGWIGELLNCYWCTGIWMTIFIVISYMVWPGWAGPAIIILAVAGLASIIETGIQRAIKE